ncbi:MAG: hypothetical protein PHU56_04350 [Candidatus Pacebacteria bacterium]|nr:hypothetical protein [Candidatus Paceibacterota bacterium]
MIKRDVAAIKRIYLEGVEKTTPDKVKKSPIFNLDKDGESVLTLNKKLVDDWRLEEWLADFKKEAAVSTAGIRGIQNILYPWDVRFPINLVGLALATIAKVLVLKEEHSQGILEKVLAGEVRYNTKLFVELISRIEAAMGVKVHLPLNRQTVPVWLVSFMIFMNDYDGGEYVTASHAVSSKTATKDLDCQGSQFLPEYSVACASRIGEIIKQAKKNGYPINISPKDSPLIIRDLDGIDAYSDYLKKGVAVPGNLSLIKKASKEGLKVLFDCGGGSMFAVMKGIFEKLGISPVFDFCRTEEDPFFYGIGKILRENQETGQPEFFDLSCDISLLDVVKTAGFEEILKDKEPGYLVIMVDPDGDRIVLGQIEPKERAAFLDKMAIGYIDLGKERIFTVYQPTFGFLMLMDFYARGLKEAGIFNDHPRMMIKTTSSSLAWDEWARFNNITVVNTPVGFKEIAAVMKKAEKQIKHDPAKEIVISDAFGKEVRIGSQPRLVFAGEENGGMIVGPEEYIKSRQGRMAMAMREKSAGEGAVLAASMAAYLFQEKKFLSDYLKETFDSNEISFRHYFRVDEVYYNESQPDPEILMREKKEGEKKRDEIYSFYLSLALALRQGKISLEDAKAILGEACGDFDFNGLKDLIFVTDGVYFKFDDMFAEIRKSGTDAKMRFFFCGRDNEKCLLLSRHLAVYQGGAPSLFASRISRGFRAKAQEEADKIYHRYFRAGL